MDTCPRCGAGRSDASAWCGLCLEPYEPATTNDAGTVVVMVTTMSAGDGDLTFPIWMRAIMSAAVLAGGVMLFEGFGPWWSVGRPVWALGLILLVVYGTLGGIFVSRLWSAASFGRREEHLVALDERTIREVEERQRSLKVESAAPAT